MLEQKPYNLINQLSTRRLCCAYQKDSKGYPDLEGHDKAAANVGRDGFGTHDRDGRNLDTDT